MRRLPRQVKGGRVLRSMDRGQVMTANKPKPAKPQVLNPRYAGATPEMVGRALLKPIRQAKRKPQKAAGSKTGVRSSI